MSTLNFYKMKINLKIAVVITYCFISSLFAFEVKGQATAEKNNLFDSDEVINIKLIGDVRSLLNDRTDTPVDFPFRLSIINNGVIEETFPIQMKTRGHFRRKKGNCTYPPLLIQFPKGGAQLNSIFNEQQKLKLVMPCRGDDFVIKEWLAYKIYNLITPLSFKVRLVQVTLEESKNNKTKKPFYGLLLEEEKQIARRNNMKAVDQKLQPQQIQVSHFLTMTVFQYLIGNTDWSIQYQQNIKLLVADSIAGAIAVPYDFDHAGIVNAPYAHPAEELLMNSIRERRYRGYCMEDLIVFENIIAKYLSLKEDIFRLCEASTLMDERSKKSTIQFLDDFFTTINDEKAWRKDFGYPCDKNGTGNVIIKGLKED